MIKNKLLVLILSITFSCNSKHSKKEIAMEIVYPEKEWLSGEIKYKTRLKYRVDSLRSKLEENYSLLIIKDGYVIYEMYNSPYLKDSLIHTNSVTKSVVSMLFGIIFKDSLVESENQFSLSYFPEFNIKDSAICKIKNKHFLSMSSGLDWKGGVDAIDVLAMSQSENWAKYVFERKIVNRPNENYLYNSGGTQVISSILHKQVSYDLEKFAADSLFAPLGIQNYQWEKTINVVPKAGWGLHLKMADMAKLGYLMLTGGVWKDKQIIPAYWVNKSTTSQININDTWDYGYQFWLPKNSEFKSFMFRGYYPPSYKIIEVIPELDIVAVYVGDNKKFKEIIESHVKIIEDAIK